MNGPPTNWSPSSFSDALSHPIIEEIRLLRCTIERTNELIGTAGALERPSHGHSQDDEPEANERKELFTLEESARLLGFSKRKIEQAVANGDLKSITHGRSRRVTRSQLDVFVRSLEIRSGFRHSTGSRHHR